MENLLRAAIEEAINRTPKGQGLQICSRCHTMKLDGKCWCDIGILSDADIDELFKERSGQDGR